MAEGGIFLDVLARLNLASIDRVLSDVRKAMREGGAQGSRAFEQGFKLDAAKAQFGELVDASNAAYRQMQQGLADLRVAEARINALRLQNFKRTSDEMIQAQAAVNKAIADSQRAVAGSRAADAAVVGAPSRGSREEPSPRDRSMPVPVSRAANVVGAGSLLAGFGLGLEGLKIDAQGEGKLNDIAARFQDTAQNVQTITQGMYKLAGETGIRFGQLADAAEAAEQAGYKGQQVVQVVETAAKAAQVAHTTVKEALSGLTTTLADFQIKALAGKPDKAVEFLEKMNDAAGKFVVTIANLKDVNPAEYFKSLANIEPVAGSYMPNVPSIQATSQVDAIAAILAQTGMPPERGMLNLAQTISKMGTAKGTSATALMQLGLQPQGIAQMMRDQGILPVLSRINEQIESKRGADGLYHMGWKFNDAGQLKALQQMDIDQLKQMGPQGETALGLLQTEPFQAGTATIMSMRKAFEKAGITDPNVTGAVLNWLKFQKTAHGPSAGIQGGMMPDLTKAQVISQLAGTGDVQRNMLAVLEHLPDVQGIMQQYQAHGNGAGLDSAFEQWKQTLPAKLQLFEGKFDELAGTLGQKLLPGAIRLVDDFNSFADMLDKHKGSFEALVGGLTGLGGLWAFTKMVKGAKELGGAFSTVKGWLDPLGQALSDRLPTQVAGVGKASEALAGAETVTAAAITESGVGSKVKTAGTAAEGLAAAETVTAGEITGSGIGVALRTAAANVAGAFTPTALGLIIADQVAKPLDHWIHDNVPGGKQAEEHGPATWPQWLADRLGADRTRKWFHDHWHIPTLGGDDNGGKAHGGIVGYKWGGKVADPYTQPLMGQPDLGRDSLLGMLPNGMPIGLRGGEGILTPEAVQAIGGKDAIDSLNNNPWSNPLKVGTTFYGSFAKGVAKYSPFGKYLVATSQTLDSLAKEFEQSTQIHEGGRHRGGIPGEIEQMLASGMSQQEILQALGATPGKKGGFRLPSGGYLSGKDRALLGLPGGKGGAGGAGNSIAKRIYSSVIAAGYDPGTALAAVAAAKYESGLNPNQWELGGSDHYGLFQESGDKPRNGADQQISWFIGALNAAGGPGAINGSNARQVIADRVEVGGYSGSNYDIGAARAAVGGVDPGSSFWGKARGGIVGYSSGGIVGFAPGGQVPMAPVPSTPGGGPSPVPGPSPNGPAGGVNAGINGAPKQAGLPRNFPAGPMSDGTVDPRWQHPQGGAPHVSAEGGAPKAVATPAPRTGKKPPGMLTPQGDKPGDYSHTEGRDIHKNPSRQGGEDNTSKGFGIGGGIIGSAESAASMAADAFAPGSGQGAQIAFALANRAIGYGGQLLGILGEGLMETLLPNDSEKGDPTKNIFGKVALGIAGAHPSPKNTAGNSAMQLKPKEDLDAGAAAGKQVMPAVHMDHPTIHNYTGNHQETGNAILQATFGLDVHH